MQGLGALTSVSQCVRWMILHKKQLVCSQRDSYSILNCFERKGTTQGTRQYGLKFWWVMTLREANLMTAGWQTVPASTNSVLLCQVTPCQASGGELLMKLSQRRHNPAFIYFRGFFQLGLFWDFWGKKLSASKSNKERKKNLSGDEARSYIWNDNVQGVLIYSSWKKKESF